MEKDIETIIVKLKGMHGEPRCELNYQNPIELTIATVLSAQCTDERVNSVTAKLFKRYTSLDDYIKTPIEELEEEIRPTGFYKNKAKAIKHIAHELKERFGGEIPNDIDKFATVKGIGRKSANMIVGLAYKVPAVIVDTHVKRVSERIGLTKEADPVKIENHFKTIFPRSIWTDLSLLLILHGRYICKANKPACGQCTLKDCCDYYKKVV